MKTLKIFVAVLATMMALVACEPFDPNAGQGGNGGNGGNGGATIEYGKGTEAEPYTVAGVVKAAAGEAWVKGYIVGFMQTGDSNYPVFSAETDSISTNILLADSIGDEVNYIAVQLPKGAVRDGINLATNKENLNKEVLMYGTIASYFSATGLKGVTYAKLGDVEFGNKPADGSDVILTQSFKQSFGEFTTYSVLGDEEWYIDTQYGYAVVTGYVNATKENHANEDWLISPAISLEGVAEAKMNIEHVLRYNNDPAAAATIWVSEDYTTGDPNSATWTQVPTNFKDAADWTLEVSKDLDLMPYVGKTVRIALKYVATTTKAGTWEVKTLNVLKGKAETTEDPGTGENPGTSSSTKENPYTVAQAIANQGAKDNGVYVWAEGYIVGVYGNSKAPIFGAEALTANQNYNVLIAPAADDYATIVCVQLPAGIIRDGVNLVDNAANLGKMLKVNGTLEPYNSMAGIKNAKEAYLDGELVTEKPLDTNGKILAESLLTQASFDKFTAYSVKGTQVWTFDAQYGAKMSGYDGSSHENEDWFISPAMNLEGKTEVKIKFEHARGPKGSITAGVAEGWYKVFVSNDYTEGDPNAATWTEIEGVNHGTSAWGYVSSGELTLPAAALKANARVAFRYLCTDAASATWEIKNVEIW